MPALLKFDPQTGRPLPRPMSREQLTVYKANPYNRQGLSVDPEHCSVPHPEDPENKVLLTKDDEHCVMEHKNDPEYAVRRASSLENITNIGYPVEARKAFLYSEILGKPLSLRRRTPIR